MGRFIYDWSKRYRFRCYTTGRTGIAIGQAEPGRSGKPSYDTPPFYASNTIPTAVYFQTTQAFPDGGADDHATAVAGVMIGRSQAPCTGCVGVAPLASLHSLAIIDINDDSNLAVCVNRLATLSADVKAINLSTVPELVFFPPDGNSHSTQFIDWSARRHDVLYVNSWGNYDSYEYRKLTDNYNGMTVAGSERFGGSYIKYWAGNATTGDAVGDRTSIDLLAPGENLRILEQGDVVVDDEEGTSFAAPFVTGTTALLHQYAVQEIGSNPRFTSNSQRHEIMKAVLLNSADKLAGVHGSNRTIIDMNGATWRDSEAFFSEEISLDDQLGAGHLNARRAVQQFGPGEYNPGLVPSIGWDYHTIGGSGSTTEYVFSSVIGGGYLAVTLTWDRRNEHSGGNTYHEGDQFFMQTVEDSLNNLDVYLLPVSSNDLGDSVTASKSFEDNVEHIFFDNFGAGSYKIVVHNNFANGIGDSQNYALAWWFGSGSSTSPGDFNGDGSVNAADYVVWRKTDGSPAGYDEWRMNFGNTSGSGGSEGVPEPGCAVMLVVAAVAMVGRRWGLGPCV